jgi:hypothetical protein
METMLWAYQVKLSHPWIEQTCKGIQWRMAPELLELQVEM